MERYRTGVRLKTCISNGMRKGFFFVVRYCGLQLHGMVWEVERYRMDGRRRTSNKRKVWVQRYYS